MAIERVKIRATVEVGDLSVSTPYIQSFNVRKQRGQVSTFDASLKVSHDEVSSAITGGAVVISAGEDTASDTIFTGICRSAKISPCYDDPKYVILSISGADQMSLLQGKKYTRRCRSSRSTWVAITGVVREGLKSGKFAYTNEPTIEVDDGKLEKQSNVTAYTGISNTDRIKTAETSSNKKDNSVQIVTQLLTLESPVP
jgi:hypothetical protein